MSGQQRCLPLSFHSSVDQIVFSWSGVAPNQNPLLYTCYCIYNLVPGAFMQDGSPGRAASGPEKGQEKYHQTGFTMEKRVLTGGTYQSQSIKGASPSQDLSPGYRDEPISCPPWLANPSVFISQVSAWAERGNIKRVRRVARWPTPNRNFAQHITLERVFRQQSYG